MNIDEYLKELKERASQKPIEDYDPKNLKLNRAGYTLENGIVCIGGPELDKKAREQSKKNLEEMFNELKKDQNNVKKLMDFAENLYGDSYHELSEEILGKVIYIDNSDAYVYHLLSRIALTKAELCKKKPKLKRKFSELSESLAERGLEYIDVTAFKLVEDRLDALHHQGKKWTEGHNLLHISFSSKYQRQKTKELF